MPEGRLKVSVAGGWYYRQGAEQCHDSVPWCTMVYHGVGLVSANASNPVVADWFWLVNRSSVGQLSISVLLNCEVLSNDCLHIRALCYTFLINIYRSITINYNLHTNTAEFRKSRDSKS